MVCADDSRESDFVDFLDMMQWETDYEVAVEKASRQQRNLLIYFRAEVDSPKLLNKTEERYVKSGNGTIRQVAAVSPSMQRPLPMAEVCRNFEREILCDMEILPDLDDYVLLTLPLNAGTKAEDGTPVTFLELPRFGEMQGNPGLAVIDYRNTDRPHHGELVGVLPFLRAKAPTPEQTSIFLNLPPGTLSQRTLIYAIRIHPERPQSTAGTPDPIVMQAALEHSQYQAKTGVLGHQNFGSRSAKVGNALGRGGASEICAQSWSGEGIYEAAIGCVRAWRSSSGHWSSAKRKHTYYGYDMVRGRNDTWYATGLFVD